MENIQSLWKALPSFCNGSNISSFSKFTAHIASYFARFFSTEHEYPLTGSSVLEYCGGDRHLLVTGWKSQTLDSHRGAPITVRLLSRHRSWGLSDSLRPEGQTAAEVIAERTVGFSVQLPSRKVDRSGKEQEAGGGSAPGGERTGNLCMSLAKSHCESMQRRSCGHADFPFPAGLCTCPQWPSEYIWTLPIWHTQITLIIFDPDAAGAAKPIPLLSH